MISSHTLALIADSVFHMCIFLNPVHVCIPPSEGLCHSCFYRLQPRLVHRLLLWVPLIKWRYQLCSTQYCMLRMYQSIYQADGVVDSSTYSNLIIALCRSKVWTVQYTGMEVVLLTVSFRNLTWPWSIIRRSLTMLNTNYRLSPILI